MRPVLAGVTGGLSGPAIRPLALRCVWQVHEALPEVPIFGVGGIRSGLDALEFVLAGASAVQVGTVIFNDPGAPSRISRELREALAARGLELPDPPGDQLEEIVIAEPAAAEPVVAVPDAVEPTESMPAPEDVEDDLEQRPGARDDDVPFDIEALGDFPSGDQDA
jgi:tRNA-dihydrouridine synthase